MTRLSLFLLALSAPLNSFADTTINPPTDITRANYQGWLRAINSNVSAFADDVFDWYEAQQKQALPAQVAADPDKIYVAVDAALQQTITHEQNGDVEEGNTIGFDAYAIMDVPISVALETKLFNWGKPIGQASGETYPFDTVFSSVHDVLTPKWGTGNYWIKQDETGGGIVQDLHDDYTILVRGDAQHGYTLFNAWYGAEGDSATQAHFSIVMLKPTADGKTEYRQCVR